MAWVTYNVRYWSELRIIPGPKFHLIFLTVFVEIVVTRKRAREGAAEK
jgi:hypothetical protein